VIRTCDGTDPNLTREIPATEYDAARHNLSPWNQSAKPGTVIIQCSCGLRFDDVDRTVIYPHHPTGGVGRAGLGRPQVITRGRQHENDQMHPRQVRYA
jgi:hypothetical protein